VEQGLTGDHSLPLDGLEASAGRLLSTSGTTGTPKIVAWDSAMLDQRIAQVRTPDGPDAQTRLLPKLGFPTTAGFRYPIATWQAGGCVLLPKIGMTPRNPRTAAGSSTLVIASPFRFKRSLAGIRGQWDNKEQRTIKLFGGRIPPALRNEALKRAAGTVLTNYGSTETGNISSGDASCIDRHSGAVGMVRPGATVQIIDEQDNVLPAESEGIVRLQADSMCHGYTGPDQAQNGQSPFRDGWFYPGDKGILFADGLFAITGRTSEVLNVEGAKISAPKIESELDHVPGVEDACAFVIPLARSDMLAVAVVCKEETKMAALKKVVSRHLQAGTPFLLFRTPSIPRNDMGKIMRRLLAEELTAKYKQLMKGRKHRHG